MKQKLRYDVLILGAGAAGIEAARQLAKGGKKVALVEKGELGGTAYYDGALPVKGILDFFKTQKKLDYKEFCRSFKVRLLALKGQISSKINDENIAIIRSGGCFISSHEYETTDAILCSDFTIIATGTSPHNPFGGVIDERVLLSHRSLLDLPEAPCSIGVLGGNVEGIELAFVFALLGFKVTVIEKDDEILLGNDKDLVQPIKNALEALGCEIILGDGVESLQVLENSVVATLESGRKLESDKALLTIARHPNLPQGLEAVGVKTENGFILVDDDFLTSKENIFAIGDINAVHGMAHVAQDQGRYVANILLNKPVVKPDYSFVPRAIFTIPELAGVGLQECDCHSQQIPYSLGEASLPQSFRGWSLEVTTGRVKVLLGKGNQLLGIWFSGNNVSELVGFLGYFVVNRRPAEELLNTLIINPGLHEAVKEAIDNALYRKVELS